jgi:hypothetical protein
MYIANCNFLAMKEYIFKYSKKEFFERERAFRVGNKTTKMSFSPIK